MATNIITPDDLQKFKRDLLDEIERLIKNLNGQPSKKWLKSADVRKMLGISPGAVKVYQKWNSGDPDTSKVAAAWFGSCIFLVIVATVLQSFFGI